jgi:hypothetical protein
MKPQEARAIRDAMAKGAQQAMSEKTYRGLDALVMMDRDGVCMASGTGSVHRIHDGVLQFWNDDNKWVNCGLDQFEIAATDWRIVPDPSQPKPALGPWAREFLTGIRDQINMPLEASQ